MPVDLGQLGIERLSVRERLELIDLLWDSLPESVEPGEVPGWHIAELARRRKEAETQPGLGRPWREALGTLGAKY